MTRNGKDKPAYVKDSIYDYLNRITHVSTSLYIRCECLQELFLWWNWSFIFFIDFSLYINSRCYSFFFLYTNSGIIIKMPSTFFLFLIILILDVSFLYILCSISLVSLQSKSIVNFIFIILRIIFQMYDFFIICKN